MKAERTEALAYAKAKLGSLVKEPGRLSGELGGGTRRQTWGERVHRAPHST